MQFRLKKSFTLFFICFLIIFNIEAQNIRNIDFFGVISFDADDNMVQMTEKLYLTQLGEVSGISIKDKRNSNFINYYKTNNEPDFSSAVSPFAFYAVINKKDSASGQWDCLLYIVEIKTNDIHSYTKTYDSYYKILMESKSSLTSIFEQLLNQNKKNDVTPPSVQSNTKASTEMLAGTWSGEEYIDKIVILRGGRGFIIYKNGATMNINVSVNNNSVDIVQSGKSNASFFPELQREDALKAATTADPIQWSLSLQNNNTLVGTKLTLIQSGTGATKGSVNVVWTRK